MKGKRESGGYKRRGRRRWARWQCWKGRDAPMKRDAARERFEGTDRMLTQLVGLQFPPSQTHSFLKLSDLRSVQDSDKQQLRWSCGPDTGTRLHRREYKRRDDRDIITAWVGRLSLRAPVTLIELSVTKSTIISTMNHLNIFISPGRC